MKTSHIHSAVALVLAAGLLWQVQAAGEPKSAPVKTDCARTADVDGRDRNGMSAFMYAAQNGHVEVMKLLLQLGATVDSKDNQGGTALIDAASSGHVEAVKLLLDNKADPSVKDLEGKTPFLWSCTVGRPAVANIFLDRGADPNARDNQGQSALMIACMGASKELVELLLQKGADLNVVDQSGRSPLILACAPHERGMRGVWMPNRHRINVPPWTYRMGQAPDMQWQRVLPPESGYDPRSDIVKVLLKNNVDLNAKDRQGRTALSWAVSQGQIDAVSVLIAAGADVNAADNQGMTPLIWAAMNGQLEILKMLAGKGAGPGGRAADEQPRPYWPPCATSRSTLWKCCSNRAQMSPLPTPGVRSHLWRRQRAGIWTW